MKLINFYFFVLITFLFPGFAFAQTPADADAMARDAIRRLEAALSGNATTAEQRTPQPAAPTQVTRGGSQPRWVDDPYTVYNSNNFIVMVRSGSDREQAEARAVSALVSFFGQSIKSDFLISTQYSEAVNNGVVNVSQNTQIRDQITRAASMDNIIGVEIGNVWDNGRGMVHVAAFMNKIRTVSIYSDMIILNYRNIDLLTTMSAAEKNTLDGFARMKLAANMAGINENYAMIITMLDGSTDLLNIRNPDPYNREAANIIRNITVTVSVNNDRANRIQDAFAKVLAGEGLRTRGTNPPYTLEVRLHLSEVNFPNNPHVFCRIEMSANLIENATGASLFPFSFNDRGGHTSYAQAENVAFTLAQRAIEERYPLELKEYLASLIPLR